MDDVIDSRVWAAIITSSVSLVLAVISLIISNKTFRKKLEQQKNITKLEASLEEKLEKTKINFQKKIDQNKLKEE